jgi:hypothetical protein
VPVAFAVAAALLLAGCRVEGAVDVTLRGDGTGVVAATLTLDRDAMARLERYGGGPLEQQVLVLDLLAAGWRSRGWERPPGGGARLRIEHPFSDPAQADDLVAALVGGSGVVREVVAARDRGVLRSRDRVAAVADLRDVTAGIGRDAALARRLRAAGVDPHAIDLLLTADLRRALTLRVTVRAAGETRSVVVRAGQRRPVDATSETFHTGRAAALGGSALLALAGTAALVAAGMSSRRSRRGRAADA